MQSHDLAKLLLSQPGAKVIGMSVGQGSNEQCDSDLPEVIVAGQESEEFKKNNWLVEPGCIGLWF